MSRNTLGQLVRTCVDTSLARRVEWDRLDAAVGDGDFGSSVARGAQALAAHWDALECGSAEKFLVAVGALLRREMGGSSGPLLAVACERAGAAAGDVETIDIAAAAAMLQAAAAGIAEYGQSSVGDKTLLDALVPTADAVALVAAQGGDTAAAYREAAAAAASGARATRDYVARRGRAVYSADRNIGAPDPGAVAVAEITAAVAAGAGVDVPDLSDLQPQTPGPTVDVATSTKKFLNDPALAALESLAGLARSVPELVRWDGVEQIIVRATPLPAGQVGLVSGGGSGHEPLHAGFVGPGMLTAAAPGAVFASPSVDQILAATRAAAGGGGVLHIVKNYTGDVLNFGLAAKAAQAEGIDVASVLVDDDVAVNDSAHTVGKRGTGATLFVHKIAGAVAEAGGTLEQVRSAAADVVRRSASFGFALTSCSPPGAGPILTLGADEIEVGVGIHGEQGRRSDHVRPAADLVAEAVDILVSSLELGAGSRVAALVNGMGGTPLMELYILFNDLAGELARRHISIERNLVGNYVTSLDMAGASFTLVAFDDQLAELWDAPAHTAALRLGR
ncbi:dihydroxyacetone kinase subunit DhaK [Mycobacterium sp. CBMA293]|nr:dihydroxyacetone kinase subunit DhaK [Mycolicibacterium sp. CBMA 360]MUL58232.1 dihydroxyacetone kinase subunit DhaK [Mycolicibacterium sp. CBMA 335]MUL73690.1 dihydroxyacetone kinase subunit DhaK [Mycolicibacterium sp. CBMA 311]MUL93115.1 dihydroxyacetone kinase subunit DhaK [Mycolicibacterium sp. CBMA 230]MUM09958.1 dihydroxyacetone kinase subunit DhaK [Mycolicibacterium sp. CBMA 293]MUM33295.1 dihydroxyacetone kinase subunit DhaK [Mycolicibacterium sp. CBMA 361]